MLLLINWIIYNKSEQNLVKLCLRDVYGEQSMPSLITAFRGRLNKHHIAIQLTIHRRKPRPMNE